VGDKVREALQNQNHHKYRWASQFVNTMWGKEARNDRHIAGIDLF